jgi:hypothetical protein
VYIRSILSSAMCFAFEFLLLKHLQYFMKSSEIDNFYLRSTHKHDQFNWMCIQLHHHHHCIILGHYKTRRMKIHLTRHKTKKVHGSLSRIITSRIWKHHGNHHKKHHNKQDMKVLKHGSVNLICSQ